MHVCAIHLRCAIKWSLAPAEEKQDVKSDDKKYTLFLMLSSKGQRCAYHRRTMYTRTLVLSYFSTIPARPALLSYFDVAACTCTFSKTFTDFEEVWLIVSSSHLCHSVSPTLSAAECGTVLTLATLSVPHLRGSENPDQHGDILI